MLAQGGGERQGRAGAGALLPWLLAGALAALLVIASLALAPLLIGFSA